MRLRIVLAFFLVLLNTAPPAPAQAVRAMAGTSIRFQNGRMEALFPNGVAPNTRLTVTLPSGTRRFQIGQTRSGLSVLPLDIAPDVLERTLRGGHSLTVTLDGPWLHAGWTVEPLRPGDRALASDTVPDSKSTGTLTPGLGEAQARLSFAGVSNNYVSFPVSLPLPADAVAVGGLFRPDPANRVTLGYALRVRDARGEWFGYFLSTETGQAASQRLDDFAYRFGAPAPADPHAPPVRPLTLAALLLATGQDLRTGAAQATVEALFVIRQTRFLLTSKAAPTPLVTVNFARRVPHVTSMVGFLHACNATQPAENFITALHPALWRIGYMWMDNRDRLVRLNIPTLLILSDSWGGGVPKDYAAWDAYVRTMAGRAAGTGFAWDIMNEPDLSGDWRGRRAQFFALFAEADRTLRARPGPPPQVSGPSLSHYDHPYIAQFLNYCLAHNVRLDILSWHELAVDDDIPSLADHLRDARRSFLDNPVYKRLGIKKIEINEIVGPSAQYEPGEILAYFHFLEQGGADGACKGCWDNNCGNATLDGILTPDTHQPRAAWWAYKAYADSIAGRVATEATDLRLVAFSSRTGSQAQVVLGDYVYQKQPMAVGDVRLRLVNVMTLPGVKKAGRVRCTLERIPNTGQAPLPSPLRVREETVPVVGGVAELTIPRVGPHEAYRVTLR